MLAERRELLDSAELVAAFAEEMSEFLATSELTETRAFLRTFIQRHRGSARPGPDPLHDPDARGQPDRALRPCRGGVGEAEFANRYVLVGRTVRNREPAFAPWSLRPMA